MAPHASLPPASHTTHPTHLMLQVASDFTENCTHGWRFIFGFKPWYSTSAMALYVGCEHSVYCWQVNRDFSIKCTEDHEKRGDRSITVLALILERPFRFTPFRCSFIISWNPYIQSCVRTSLPTRCWNFHWATVEHTLLTEEPSTLTMKNHDDKGPIYGISRETFWKPALNWKGTCQW